MTSTGAEINFLILTSPDGFDFLAQQELQCPVYDEDFAIDLRSLKQCVMQNAPFNGKAISLVLPIISRDDATNSYQMIDI
jgi:hypothetical protein